MLMGVLLACTLASAQMIHVSPGGKPDAPGTAQEPATLQRAIELARKGQAKHVQLAAGEYYDVALTLTAADEGLTVSGPETGTATLYGGVPLAGWRKEGANLVCDVPKNLDTPVRLLIVNGEMAQRARWPQEGYLLHETVFPVRWMSTTAGGWERKPTDEELLTMQYKAGDLPDGFVPGNAEVTVYHMWDESCVPVASVDPATRIIRFREKLGHPAGAFGVQKYVVWNTVDGLQRPGQFYHDREAGRIVYRPREGETPAGLKAIAGKHERVIHLRGEKEKPVRNITLKNLAISATTVPGRSGGFGALGYPGAVQLSSTGRITLQNLHIKNVAAQGIDGTWSADHEDVTIENCHVEHTGAGGIAVGGKRIVIRNNHVHHVGGMFPSGIAIARNGTESVIENNEIHDTTYSAIACGGNKSVYRRNLIYRVMTELFDGGAIYLGGAKDCIVEENVCRDIGGKGGYSRTGYYLDEQCDGCIVRRNIAINVDMPLQNHMARNCIIEENVLVNDGELALGAARCENYIARRNVVRAGGKISIRSINAYKEWSDNIVFSAIGEYETIATDLYQTKAKQDSAPEGSIVENPLLRLRFEYGESSPARKLNLPVLDASMAGRR